MSERIVIVSDGETTQVLANGEVYTDGVSNVSFSVFKGNEPNLQVTKDTFPNEPAGEEEKESTFRTFLDSVLNG